MTELHIFKKDDTAALNEYLSKAQAQGGEVQVTQHASVLVHSNDQLHGLPPLDSLPQRVNLIAPEPVPGEEARWLFFKQTDSIYWTADLVAVVAT